MSGLDDLLDDLESPGGEPSEAEAGDGSRPGGRRPRREGSRRRRLPLPGAWRRRAARGGDPEPSPGAERRVGNPGFPGPIVELVDVTRFFPGPPAVNALRGVDLTVARGDYLAIIGPSGSGKSTMLNTLGLLDRPSTGRFRFEGIDVAELDDDARTALRARAIGFVFQSFHLLATRTVLENVMLAGTYAGVGPGDREELARAALARVGLEHRIDATPNRLSGGERQRVAIARAVSTSPRLLLADEPTGNLDRENSESIMRLFEQLGRDGLTIVMITHDAAVAEAAHRRVRINDGELSELA